MGETVNLDEKGRIIIPAEVRRVVNKKAFKVEVVDKNTIILKAIENRSDLVKRVAKIRLKGDKERVNVDAASVKDLFGGKSDEDP